MPVLSDRDAGRMLVPYNPPPARCRRSDDNRAIAQRSFTQFIQNGGRVAPIQLRPAPNDEESTPLMAGRTGKDNETLALELMRSTSKQTRAMCLAVIVALLFTTISLAILGYVAWRVNENVDAAERALAPHASKIVNTTVDMLNDMGGTWSSMHEISEYTEGLAASAGGTTGSAAATMNSSAIIAKKLAEFMAHPTIQLSLGGSGGN